MKKICNILCLLVLSFLIGNASVKAASANIAITSSASTVIVGRTFNVSVTVSSDVVLGNWEYTLGYDSSKLDLISGNAYVMEFDMSQSLRKKTYNYTFRAKGSGTGKIYIQSALVNGLVEGGLATTKGSRSIILKTQAEIEASYSKNNYLSSLGVEGMSLSPNFNKDTLEYTVEMEPGTTKVKLNGAVEDKTASVEGLGEKEVSEGANRFEVKVTAQNGNIRTYLVIVNVKEYNPIEVEVNGKTLKVVRKRSDLIAPQNYTETNIRIGEEEVPAYTSEITKYILVGLKDEEGNIALYRYESDTYTLYQEFSFHKVYISLLEAKEIPKRYHKTTIQLDEKEVTVYKIKDNSKYALLYALNVETGKENWYVYNQDEHTIQIYNTEELELLEQESEKYFMIGIALGGISLVLLIILIIVICKKNKKKEKIVGAHQKKKKEIKEELASLE